MDCIVHGSWKVWHDWASFTFILIHFSSLIPKMSIFNLAISCLTTFNLPWFIGPGSYGILFVTALEFTSITIHLHNWASFLLWPSRFILSGAISNCPLLFASSTLDTFQPGLGGLIFQHHILLFQTVHGVLQARILEWVSISFSSGPHFIRTLHYDPLVLGGPAWCGSLSYTSPFPTTSVWWWRGFYHYHLYH